MSTRAGFPTVTVAEMTAMDAADHGPAIPDPSHPTRRPDPSRWSSPMPLGDTVPDPDRLTRPGDPAPDPVPNPSDGRLAFVAAGREDSLRHVVDVVSGELGDPSALRARCGAPVAAVVPHARVDAADCPTCRVPVPR